MRLHHVQVSSPPGGEDAQRRFYDAGLGLSEVPKPAELAGRGGCWFRGGDGVEVHVGIEQDFIPAGKAHPAFLLADLDTLERTAATLTDLGFAVDWSERDTFAGMTRLHTRDGAGNRVEVMTPATGGGVSATC